MIQPWRATCMQVYCNLVNGADGAALARATTQAETCVVGCVS